MTGATATERRLGSPAAPVTLLSVSGLHKAYAGPVLTEVSLEIRRGEVHALVGENGAGKSTLSRIIAGLTRPDAGRMELSGTPYTPASKREAERRGVRLVLQELNLIPNLSVAENLFFERMPHWWGWIQRDRLARQATALLAEVGLAGLDPDRPIQSLGIGQQQMVAIAVGLAQPAELLILDEPTAALATPEIDRLFAILRQRRSAGTAVLYISHRLEEIQQIADRISVLRDGRLVATRPAAGFALDEIIRTMVGRELGATSHRPARLASGLALRVEGLRRLPAVRDVSFELYRGEILGFAGLMGSGRTETVRAIFGADRAEAGTITLHGEAAPKRIRSPRDAVRAGMALLTESRKDQGLWLPLPARTNITLPSLPGLSPGGCWVRATVERATAQQWVDQLAIRCASLEQPAVELSGGNQQKLVMARWLAREGSILIFDEPTRGIDVGAKFEIYRWLGELAAAGKAIILVSSDLLELMAVCDRIAVMSAGRIAGVFPRERWSQDAIMAAALSGHLRPANQESESHDD